MLSLLSSMEEGDDDDDDDLWHTCSVCSAWCNIATSIIKACDSKEKFVVGFCWETDECFVVDVPIALEHVVFTFLILEAEKANKGQGRRKEILAGFFRKNEEQEGFMERKSSFGSSDYNHYSVEKKDDDPQATNTLLTALQAYGAGERWGKGKQVAQSLLMELRQVEKIIDGFFKTCRDVSEKFSLQAFLVGLHEKGYFKISPDFMVIKKKDEEEGRTLYLAKWFSGRVAKVVLAMTNGYRSHGSGTRTLKISGKLTGRSNPGGDMLNDAQWLLVSGKDSFVHCPEDHE